MPSAKEELVVAGLAKQIAYLEGLLKELESNPTEDPHLAQKIRDIEDKIRSLRVCL